jgi:hypothetical protein
MSTTSTSTAAPTGVALSEDAVRRVLHRRRRTAAGTSSADTPGGRTATASPAPRVQPLRRWSVAELIARALAAPSTGPARR